MIEFRVFQEGLGGDAAPVEAGAAGAVRFDASDGFSELGGADGGDVAGWAATDDNEIVGHGSNEGAVCGGKLSSRCRIVKDGKAGKTAALIVSSGFSMLLA